jgi:DNA-directed RNA polymerase specialized sigma24 family protein
MVDKSLNIWQVALIESHLQSRHGPAKIAAVQTAYVHGFEVEEIAAVSGLPVERVRQAILGDPTKRTGDN